MRRSVNRTCPNPNHPKKGQRIRAGPIRRLRDIGVIRGLLAGESRNLLLFTMGINSGLRVGDLLNLKVGDVRYLKPGASVTVTGGRTDKENILVINRTVHRALTQYLEDVQPEDGDWLFPSRKTGEPLTVQAVNALIKKWTRAAGLRGNYGAHTLRKTFGYIQRTCFGVGFDVLARRFGHSGPAVTRRYLGIQDGEVSDAVLNEI